MSEFILGAEPAQALWWAAEVLLQSGLGFAPSSGPNLDSSYEKVFSFLMVPRKVLARLHLCQGHPVHPGENNINKWVLLVCCRPSHPEVSLMGCWGKAPNHAAEWGDGVQPPPSWLPQGWGRKGCDGCRNKCPQAPKLATKGFQSRAIYFLSSFFFFFASFSHFDLISPTNRKQFIILPIFVLL